MGSSGLDDLSAYLSMSVTDLAAVPIELPPAAAGSKETAAAGSKEPAASETKALAAASKAQSSGWSQTKFESLATIWNSLGSCLMTSLPVRGQEQNFLGLFDSWARGFAKEHGQFEYRSKKPEDVSDSKSVSLIMSFKGEEYTGQGSCEIAALADVFRQVAGPIRVLRVLDRHGLVNPSVFPEPRPGPFLAQCQKVAEELVKMLTFGLSMAPPLVPNVVETAVGLFKNGCPQFDFKFSDSEIGSSASDGVKCELQFYILHFEGRGTSALLSVHDALGKYLQSIGHKTDAENVEKLENLRNKLRTLDVSGQSSSTQQVNRGAKSSHFASAVPVSTGGEPHEQPKREKPNMPETTSIIKWNNTSPSSINPTREVEPVKTSSPHTTEIGSIVEISSECDQKQDNDAGGDNSKAGESLGMVEEPPEDDDLDILDEVDEDESDCSDDDIEEVEPSPTSSSYNKPGCSGVFNGPVSGCPSSGLPSTTPHSSKFVYNGPAGPYLQQGQTGFSGTQGLAGAIPRLPGGVRAFDAPPTNNLNPGGGTYDVHAQMPGRSSGCIMGLGGPFDPAGNRGGPGVRGLGGPFVSPCTNSRGGTFDLPSTSGGGSFDVVAPLAGPGHRGLTKKQLARQLLSQPKQDPRWVFLVQALAQYQPPGPHEVTGSWTLDMSRETQKRTGGKKKKASQKEVFNVQLRRPGRPAMNYVSVRLGDALCGLFRELPKTRADTGPGEHLRRYLVGLMLQMPPAAVEPGPVAEWFFRFGQGQGTARGLGHWFAERDRGGLSYICGCFTSPDQSLDSQVGGGGSFGRRLDPPDHLTMLKILTAHYPYLPLFLGLNFVIDTRQLHRVSAFWSDIEQFLEDRGSTPLAAVPGYSVEGANARREDKKRKNELNRQSKAVHAAKRAKVQANVAKKQMKRAAAAAAGAGAEWVG